MTRSHCRDSNSLLAMQIYFVFSLLNLKCQRKRNACCPILQRPWLSRSYARNRCDGRRCLRSCDGVRAIGPQLRATCHCFDGARTVRPATLYALCQSHDVCVCCGVASARVHA